MVAIVALIVCFIGWWPDLWRREIMSEALKLWEYPAARESYLIAGWRQWADAGSISSGLPEYLVERTKARLIGEIAADGFYLFQIPGAHHFLRPEIKLEDGYRKEIRPRRNEFFYTELNEKGVVIFLGEEPHLNIDGYAEAFFAAAKMLGVRRVGVLGGVYGSVPYDKDRTISCVYSMPHMKSEMEKYAVRFSNYEGGVSIGSYLADRAEHEGVEYFTFYGFVPAYDFSQSNAPVQGLRVEHDYRAWYEIMRRFNFMFELGIDLSELARQSDELVTSLEAKFDELKRKAPQLRLDDYLERLGEEYEELSFMPLDDVWARELNDILRDLEE
jgi:predicted ATP-grasp superfamily ATP-dependent carboligase